MAKRKKDEWVCPQCAGRVGKKPPNKLAVSAPYAKKKHKWKVPQCLDCGSAVQQTAPTPEGIAWAMKLIRLSHGLPAEPDDD